MTRSSASTRSPTTTLATSRRRTCIEHGLVRFSLLELDLADADLTALVADVDGVFHLAAQPGYAELGGHLRRLRPGQHPRHAAPAGGGHASRRARRPPSSSVYGNAEAYPTFEDAPLHPVSPYGVSKLACESLARAYAESFGLDVVSLRYFTVYGPRQRPDMAFSRIVASLLNGRPFELFGTGEQSRDFTYVDDAVAATLTAMRGTPRSGVYNVGGGGETTLAEVIAICERLCGKRLDVRRGPASVGDVRRTAADTSLIRSQLGWSPGTALEEGLAAQLSAAAERA